MKISLSYPVILLLTLTINFYEDRPKSKSSELPTLSEETPENKTQQHSKKEHYCRDAKTGLKVYSLEIPSSWEAISRPIYVNDRNIPNFLFQMKGPNGFLMFNIPTKVFTYYSDTYMANAIQQQLRNKVKPVATLEQLISQEVAPRMQKSGFRRIKNRRLPALEAKLEAKSKQMLLPTKNRLIATQWENSKGKKAFVMIVQNAFRVPLLNHYMDQWSYGIDYVFSDSANFEQTISYYTQALNSIKFSSRWQQYHQNLMAQRQQESNRRHQQTMYNQRAQFQAHQEKMKGIWAAQDANHASFMNRNFGASSNHSQNNYINMIRDEETIFNPQTGKNYQVDAGYNDYWIDSHGNLIQSNNAFYSPNGDINLSHSNWVKVKKQQP